MGANSVNVFCDGDIIVNGSIAREGEEGRSCGDFGQEEE